MADVIFGAALNYRRLNSARAAITPRHCFQTSLQREKARRHGERRDPLILPMTHMRRLPPRCQRCVPLRMR